MQEYSFYNLVEDLVIGREIEFEYNDNLYEITHNDEYWHFYDDSKKISEKIVRFKTDFSITDTAKKNAFNDYLKSKIIDGKTVETIFNNNLFHCLIIF